MSPKALACGPVRSAAELNDLIRALWQRVGGRPFTPDERAEYEQLVVAWAEAVRAEAEIVEAA